jgi:hypothetical protein
MEARMQSLTQLDHISDDTHDHETHAYGLGYLDEFLFIRCSLSVRNPQLLVE